MYVSGSRDVRRQLPLELELPALVSYNHENGLND